MMEEDLAHYAVSEATRLGFQYAEARLQMDRAIMVGMSNGLHDVPVSAESAGLGIRGIYRGVMGFISINSLSRDSVVDALQRLRKTLEVVSSTGKGERIKLSDEEVLTANWSADERTKFEDLDFDQLSKLLKDFDSIASASQKIKQRVIRLRASLQLKYLVTSEGTIVRSRVPRFLLMGFLTAYDSSDIAQRFVELGGSGGLEVLERIHVAERFKEEVHTVDKIVGRRSSMKEGKYDVVVGPEVAGIMAHESIGHPFEADRIRGREGAQGGESYVRDLESPVIGSKEAFISDDPTIPFSYGFFLFDEEGVKARKKELVKEGKINELLHNRETAGEMGIKSNASARASSYAVEPIIRMSNTFVEPGSWSLDEMLKEVNEGIFIKSFMEWNIDDRRLNQRYVGFEAYRIEKHELKEPVKGMIIETTTPNLWGRLYARSRDLEFVAATCGKGDPEQGVPVWTGGPYLLFKDLPIKVR
ncbi:MAG: TldD/PmbA family protein [Nitrososphaeria archaeon]